MPPRRTRGGVRRLIPDALELVTDDHAKIEQLFARFERLGRGSIDVKRVLVREIVRELSIHSAIEEGILYRAFGDAFPEEEETVAGHLEEHRETARILAVLDGNDPAQRGYDALVSGLISSVRRHVAEEEATMLPMLRDALPAARLAGLGREMEKAKRTAPTRPPARLPDVDRLAMTRASRR